MKQMVQHACTAPYHMVELQHVSSTVFQHLGQRVTNDGGPQVANMHLFGNIWGGEVNDYALPVQAGCP